MTDLIQRVKESEDPYKARKMASRRHLAVGAGAWAHRGAPADVFETTLEEGYENGSVGAWACGVLKPSAPALKVKGTRVVKRRTTQPGSAQPGFQARPGRPAGQLEHPL